MPIYSIKCAHCGSAQDIYRPLKDYDNLPDCCEHRMERQVCAPFVQTDIAPYKSMVTGEMIQSRSQHRSHLKQHRMIEVGNEQPKQQTELKPIGDLKKDLYQTFAGYGL
jgi:hypothetical protein